MTTLQPALRIFFVLITATSDRNSEAGGSDLAQRPDWFADLVVKTLHHSQSNTKQKPDKTNIYEHSTQSRQKQTKRSAYRHSYANTHFHGPALTA